MIDFKTRENKDILYRNKFELVKLYIIIISHIVGSSV